MKSLLVLALVSSAAFAESKAPEFVKNLGGCYAVSYRFVEAGRKDYILPNEHMKEVNEWITVKDTDKKSFHVQHYGVYKDQETGKYETMVHFGEDWSSADGVTWVQRVLSPSGAEVRYTCSSPVKFGQFRCQELNAAKPQRDINRKDYDVIKRLTTVQIKPEAWIQVEVNEKVKVGADKKETVVSSEVGWIEYKKLADDKVCADAKKEFPQAE